MSSHINKKILVLGALSAIGEATARIYASEGAELILAGRNADRLSQVANDLKARGAAKCTVWQADLANCDYEKEFEKMLQTLGGDIDVALLFYGYLGNQEKAQNEQAEFNKILDVNFLSAANWANIISLQLEKQDSGTLIAISSVAGDRGRQSNYVYGAAKAGLTILIEGIAHRLAPSNASACVVKLGFVDTPMTAHIEKGGPLWAKPEKIAKIIKKTADKVKSPIVYAPWFWRFIMLIIKSVPTFIFHKTKL